RRQDRRTVPAQDGQRDFPLTWKSDPSGFLGGPLPHAGGVVPAAGRDPTAVRAERHGLDHVAVPERGADLRARVHVPQPGSSVAGPRQGTPAVGTENRRVNSPPLPGEDSPQLSGGRVPQLGRVVTLADQDVLPVRAERGGPDPLA